MTEFTTRQYVRHSPQQMFALVADIEAYPQFVPLCDDLKIIERQVLDDGKGEILIADMTMAYKLFRETFRSRVTLSSGRGAAGCSKILVEYLDGPFSHLENIWQFHAKTTGDDERTSNAGGNAGGDANGDGHIIAGTNVEFYIAYEFKSRSVQMMVGPVVEKVFRRFITAFEARADMLYGV